MSEDQPDTHTDDEFEVTDLRSPRRSAGGQARFPHLSTWTWQRLLLGLSLLLLVAVLLGNVLYRTGVARGLSSTPMPPTATPMAASTQAVALSPPPNSGLLSTSSHRRAE